MTRLRPLTEDELNDEQRTFLDALNSGPRVKRHGRLGLVGPFGVWTRAPHVGHSTQQLGATLRFETHLPENVKEVAICTVGAFYRAKFEFAAHRRLALKAGVDEASLDRLQAGEAPDFEGDEAIAHSFTAELVRNGRTEDSTYDRAASAFGETGLIELVTIVGYYALISFTLNAFDVPLVEGMDDPFPGN